MVLAVRLTVKKVTSPFSIIFSTVNVLPFKDSTILEINKQEMDASKDKFNQILRNVVL